MYILITKEWRGGGVGWGEGPQGGGGEERKGGGRVCEGAWGWEVE